MIVGRSPVVRLGVQVATPIAAVLAVFVLFAGHNQPGGGFAAGLLVGGIVILRTTAALPRPRNAMLLLSAGALLAGAVALLPLAWGDPALDQVVVEATLPLLGDVKSGTALLFDIGVVLIVVGLVVALVEGFEASDLSVSDASGPPTSALDDNPPAPPPVASREVST